MTLRYPFEMLAALNHGDCRFADTEPLGDARRGVNIASSAVTAFPWNELGRRRQQLFDLNDLDRRQRLRTMDRAVVVRDVCRLGWENVNVLRAIVITLLVDVVNDFASFQWSTECRFSDQSATFDIPTTVGGWMPRHVNNDVATFLSHLRIIPLGPVVRECYKAFMRGAAAGLKV